MSGSVENFQGLIRPTNVNGLKPGDGKISRGVGTNRRVLSEIDKNVMIGNSQRCVVGNNRRALSEIDTNVVVGQQVNKRGVLTERDVGPNKKPKPVIPGHRPVTRKFAAQLAEKEQQPLVAEKEKQPLVEENTEVTEVEMEDVEVDIDSQDKNNALAVTEYIDDLYAYYKNAEKLSSVPPNYMVQQSDVNERMRAILIDWLVEVHYKFELMDETLYLTVNLIDRFLSVNSVVRKKLQLVGVSALFLACKYEEVSVPVVDDLVLISDKAYSRKEVLHMEKSMLNTLQYNLSIPTPYVFMKRFLKAAQSDKKLDLLSFFLIELCLVEYEMLKFPPSLLAAAAIFTAQSTLLGHKHWSKTSERHTSYTMEELLGCAKLMVTFHKKSGSGKLSGVQKKYSTSKYGNAAKQEPAVFLMDE